MIDISDFSMIEKICSSHSLTKAAELLHVSQPTLSKRLSRLETQLNAKLFHRTPGGLRPTVIANYLLQSSAPIKSKVASIERQVERMLNNQQGELRIGVGPIIEQLLLPSVLIELTQLTGDVTFTVLTEHADVLLEQLKSGQLDVIAGPFDTQDPTLAEEGIVSFDLIRERTISVARAEHPVFLSADENAFSHYTYAAPGPQGVMLKRSASGRYERRLTSDNYTLLKSLVLATDYLCSGPRGVFKAELASGAMREVPNAPSVEWQSACLIKAEALETPLVKLFISVLGSQLGKPF